MGIEPTMDLISPPPDLKSGSATRLLATPILGNMIFCKTLFENNCFYSYSYGPLIVNYIVCYKLNQDQIKVPTEVMI